MEFHDAANIFPMLTGDEFAALVDDIRANGQREPITLCDGKILDGRNRYSACLELGIEPKYREWDGEGSPTEFVISENLHRRHLDASQRAAIAVDIERRLAMDNTRAPKWTIQHEAILPHVIGQNRDIAAKIVATSPRYVQEAKRIAQTAPDLLEQVRAGDLTIPQAKREAVRREYNTKAPTLPDGKYRVIYADPPWQYGNTQPDYHTVQDDHYPTMPLSDICALPICEIAESNAVLFLWATSPILEEAFRVIRSWGFEYKTSFVWDKIKHNMGHYNSVRHEFLLVCVRGSCQPDVRKLFDSVVSEERTEHSRKPEVFREIIDTLYPTGRRIELFARRNYDGWDIYGNEPALS